jgi:hypothetical protein
VIDRGRFGTGEVEVIKSGCGRGTQVYRGIDGEWWVVSRANCRSMGRLEPKTKGPGHARWFGFQERNGSREWLESAGVRRPVAQSG